MKNSMATKLALGFFMLGLAVQASAKPTSDDFNSMIEENSAAQKELSHQLEKQLAPQKITRNQKPNFIQVGEDVLGKGTSENVVASTDIKNEFHKAPASKDALEKKNFKRLSEEIKDIKE